MSATDIDKVGKEEKLGCFQTASRRILKRKHSETEENIPKQQKRSFFSTIGAKLGFSRSSNNRPKSILSPTGSNRCAPSGEVNRSYQHDYSSFVTNGVEQEHEIHPKKRVKFDEENLIFSSITYQRKQTETQTAIHLFEPATAETKSIFSKFINYTANLF